MQFDFDDCLLPWDLDLKIQGVVYPTRPLCLADVALLQKAVTAADGSIEGLVDTIARLFEGERPPVETWDPIFMLGAVKAVVEYWKGLMGKNSEAIATHVKSAMAKLSGSSTQP